jgi:hypothetical protein
MCPGPSGQESGCFGTRTRVDAGAPEWRCCSTWNILGLPTSGLMSWTSCPPPRRWAAIDGRLTPRRWPEDRRRRAGALREGAHGTTAAPAHQDPVWELQTSVSGPDRCLSGDLPGRGAQLIKSVDECRSWMFHVEQRRAPARPAPTGGPQPAGARTGSALEPDCQDGQPTFPAVAFAAGQVHGCSTWNNGERRPGLHPAGQGPAQLRPPEWAPTGAASGL